MKLPAPREDPTQKLIVAWLRAHGVIVYVSSRRAKRCPNCKTYSHRGDGADKGLADLICRRPTWPRSVCVALEVKRPGKWEYSSDEQRIADVAGDIVVVQSPEEAMKAIDEADRFWRS